MLRLYYTYYRGQGHSFIIIFLRSKNTPRISFHPWIWHASTIVFRHCSRRIVQWEIVFFLVTVDKKKKRFG